MPTDPSVDAILQRALDELYAAYDKLARGAAPIGGCNRAAGELRTAYDALERARLEIKHGHPWPSGALEQRAQAEANARQQAAAST
jgi:hypothetical protein